MTHSLPLWPFPLPSPCTELMVQLHGETQGSPNTVPLFPVSLTWYISIDFSHKAVAQKLSLLWSCPSLCWLWGSQASKLASTFFFLRPPSCAAFIIETMLISLSLKTANPSKTTYQTLAEHVAHGDPQCIGWKSDWMSNGTNILSSLVVGKILMHLCI